jgi:hypothetical protein
MLLFLPGAVRNVEQYAAYIYTSTSVIKMLFLQQGTACVIRVTVYFSGGGIAGYSSAFPNLRARSFQGRKIYYSDSGGRYCGTVRLVLRGRICYRQFDPLTGK